MHAPQTPPASTPPGKWRALWRAYPKTVGFLLLIVTATLAADAALGARWWRYRDETQRLRANMTDAERQQADLELATEQHQLRVTLELVRRQARGDRELHLAVAVDSGRMYLEREGVVLRTMDVRIGAERLVGAPPDTVRLAAPRGSRTITRVLSAGDSWSVPQWVFEERGLPVPESRDVKGGLGKVGVVLSGGTLIYSTPSSGPLADSSFTLPGSILMHAKDLAAIAPNLAPGLAVYFY